MKTTRSAMTTHLQQEVTTLCTCWRIERRDGAVFTFTNHDVNLVINGRVYESQFGFTATAISGASDMSVANLEITGALDSTDIINTTAILDSFNITDADMRNRLFDFASIYIFVTDWTDPVEDDLKIRRGWLGEVTLSQNGEFMAEVRGMMQALSHNTIEDYSPECRADFCSPRCGLNIADHQHRVAVVGVTDNQHFATSGVLDAYVGGDGVGSHRYWQFRFPIASRDGAHNSFAEMQFFDSASLPINGAHYYASSHWTGGFLDLYNHPPEDAHDGQPGSYWQTGNLKIDPPNTLPDPAGLVNSWWVFDAGHAIDPRVVSMTSTKQNYLETPTTFDLYYSSGFDPAHPEEATWTFASTHGYEFTGPTQSPAWNIGATTSDPINFPTDPGVLPTPNQATPTTSQNWDAYLTAYPDVADGYFNADKTKFPTIESFAAWHYQNYGKAEGRMPPAAGLTSIEGDWSKYLAMYPAVETAWASSDHSQFPTDIIYAQWHWQNIGKALGYIAPAGLNSYVGGLVTFVTGPNKGASMEIVSFNPDTQTLTMFEPFKYTPAAGDFFDITAGCDKKFTTCKLYNNTNNFRGEPRVPGQDVLLNYPNAPA